MTQAPLSNPSELRRSLKRRLSDSTSAKAIDRKLRRSTTFVSIQRNNTSTQTSYFATCISVPAAIHASIQRGRFGWPRRRKSFSHRVLRLSDAADFRNFGPCGIHPIWQRTVHASQSKNFIFFLPPGYLAETNLIVSDIGHLGLATVTFAWSRVFATSGELVRSV
jgi:hypothetical protein